MIVTREHSIAAQVRRRGVLAVILLVLAVGSAHAAQVVIDGPPGSGVFGRVTTLPNGNIVVIDSSFDAPGPVSTVGAVHLYRPDGTLISTLTGSHPGDQVGVLGVTILTTGDFVVASHRWRNGEAAAAGAVTWISGTTGLSGVVSPSNSLVGSSTGDQVGSHRVTALSDGAYLVRSASWHNGAIADAGAVTLSTAVGGVSGVVSAENSLVGSSIGDQVGLEAPLLLANGNLLVRVPGWDNGPYTDAGAVTFVSTIDGISGVVSPTNSLVGSSAGDRVGGAGVTLLSNGNYVVASPDWRHGAVAEAGAATFGSGEDGVTGPVSAINSLVGTSTGDRVAGSGVTALSNGNYVVASHLWRNGTLAYAGAVTFGSGISGIAGAVSQSNSLVGDRADAFIGFRVAALTNGNYVVSSPFWDTEFAEEVGAVTFASGTSGLIGHVSPANSLVGTGSGQLVGLSGATPLTNGNFVVSSPRWNHGDVLNVGAATFGSGTTGIVGTVSPSNSLIGSTAEDRVSEKGVVALANGNYVVRSTHWDNGAANDAGAVTFGSGTSGISGEVSTANSLVGSSRFDRIGGHGVVALPSGNYVVLSPEWDNGASPSVGAATFGSGIHGVSGEISVANSLIGGSSGDGVSSHGVTVLTNGHYVVRSASWSNAGVYSAGAVTFGSASSGVVGVVSPSNSLVGSQRDDQVGIERVIALSNGNYVIESPDWDNGAVFDAGAITLGVGDGSVTGELSNVNSVLGSLYGSGYLLSFGYDPVRNQLAVGKPRRNRVILHRPGAATATNIVGGPVSPSPLGEALLFTAIVSASDTTPEDGRVTFTASTGESCVDTTPTPVSAISVRFSCTIEFTEVGVHSVIAEYTGSVTHAYSGSSPRLISLIDRLFGDGFEASVAPASSWTN